MFEMYKLGQIHIFSEPLLLRSTFGSLVQGHLKALNILSFYLLLVFRQSGVLQGILYCSTLGSLAGGQRLERLLTLLLVFIFVLPGRNLPWFSG